MDNPLVQPDPGLFIWTILTFLVLVTLLAWFGWRPLLKLLEAREEKIRKSLEDAAKATIELERLQNESAALIRNARIEAEAIVSRSRSEGESARDELRARAKTEADAILREAKSQIEMEKTQALREIRGQVADLSISIASKLLERNITKEDNEKLISDTIGQL